MTLLDECAISVNYQLGNVDAKGAIHGILGIRVN